MQSYPRNLRRYGSDSKVELIQADSCAECTTVVLRCGGAMIYTPLRSLPLYGHLPRFALNLLRYGDTPSVLPSGAA